MKLNVAIGFVTGRRHFQNVLKSYINNWIEHGLIEDDKIRIHLFVAYDLKYHGTAISDYKDIPPELAKLVDSINFYGAERVAEEINALTDNGILTLKEGRLLFGEGYGKKRNIITYFAVRKKMDRLIFIDDDEYPMSTMKNDSGKLIWMGQRVVGTHIKYSAHADITHGHHCGYISPIPFIRFNDILTEDDFKDFIQAISNDIISWEKIRDLMIKNKGVTYAVPEIINKSLVTEIPEENGMKFISGANLCFNLSNAVNLPPFYNPPGARGEDTFMSTALSKLRVIKVPCYTFHDGFALYHHLLNGVLPLSLEAIDSLTPGILKRFVHATVGWIRYKPLLVYITQRADFERTMMAIKEQLTATIPKLCAYFNTHDFEKVLQEFNYYWKNVEKHFNDFELTKSTWARLMRKLNHSAYGLPT